MSFSPFPTPAQRAKTNGPRYEFGELAQHFGIETGQLRNAVRNAPTPAPSPKLVLGRRRWYCLAEFKAWWVSFEDKDFTLKKPGKGQSVLTH
jgi:hypothetical protein